MQWAAPEGCPDRDAVVARVVARAGRADLDVDVTVVVEDGVFVARVGARELRDASCAALADAVAIVVARMIADAAAARVEREPPRPAPAVEVQAVREPWRFAAWAAVLAGVGPARDLDAAGGIGLGVARGSWFGAVGVGRSLTVGHAVDAGTVDLHVDAATARLGCERGLLRAWLVVDGGAVVAAGTDFPNARTGRAPWLAAGAGLGVHWRYLTAGLEILAAASTLDVTLSDGTSLYRTRRGAARATLGIEWPIP